MKSMLKKITHTILVAFILPTLLFSCGDWVSLKKKNNAPSSPALNPPPISNKDLLDLKKSTQQPKKELELILLSKSEHIPKIKNEIESRGGEIKILDEKVGLIQFTMKGSEGLKLYQELSTEIDVLTINREVKVDFNPEKENTESNNLFGNSQDQDIYPSHVMKATDLKNFILNKYGKEINGENSVIAVFDTGIDLGRTDAFQDRIVYLKSLRQEDFATVTEAQLELIDGKNFFTAEINGTKVFIEQTEKLKKLRTYYLGYFSEKQFKGHTTSYNNYDLNQDGKDDAIFPIITFKNDSGIFETYIKTTYKLSYPAIGDFSIENEIPLYDFNLVANTIKEQEGRYVKNFDNEILSYYRFTTRLDSVKNGKILDKSKGLINVGITLSPSDELTDDGLNLKRLESSPLGKNYYHIGIVGLDFMGHGTHVAGIAAGNYHKSANAFSSVANKAKIVGVTYLGGTASQSSFIKTVLELIQKYPNIIFNFSFGGNILFNESQDQYALIFDRIAETYHTPFIKSAGNEGPGFNSHGVVASERMITVSNFFATNSRKSFGVANYPDDEYYLSTSSSRGPMIDGTHKPDIGAPGWVLSALPLAKPLGENKERNFEYWSGTSMASPNVAQVLALLYDAAEKTGLGKGIPGSPAIKLDKMSNALKNGAIPYSTYPYAECIGKGNNQNNCKIKIQEKKTSWWEGGAGRINALSTFKILEETANSPVNFYKTVTSSYIDGFHKKANGFLSIDNMVGTISFEIELFGEDDLENLNRMETLNLVIADEIDWLYFDPNFKNKNYQFNLFNKTKRAINLYVDLSKITESGRIKGGVHQAIVKGYNSRHPNYFEMTFPVTFVGYHSKFDSNLLNDNFKLATRGFIPAGQSISYFIPIENEGEAVIVDLDVNDPWPGDMVLSIFHQGIQLPTELFLSPYNRASSLSGIYGPGRGHLRYLLHELPKGLYEIALSSDRNSNYQFEGISLNGSHYNLNAEKISMRIDSLHYSETEKSSTISLINAFNPGNDYTVASASTSIQKFKKLTTLEISDKDLLTLPIAVAPGMSKLQIKTKYNGVHAGTDIDIQLFDESGKMVGSSMTASGDESISLSVDKAGTYLLKIIAYAIPAGKDSFELSLEQLPATPAIFSTNWQGPNSDSTLKEGFKWRHNRTYNFQTTFPRPVINSIDELKDYRPILSVAVEAFYGSDKKKITIFKRDIN